MMKHIVVMAALMISATASAKSYELTLIDDRWPDRPFIVEVPASNTKGIERLEQYFKSGINLDGKGNLEIGIASGKVEAVQPTDSHRWHFRIDPKTVSFADVTAEVCDSSLMGIEENVQQWITTVKRFCPWNTRSLLKSFRIILP